MELQPQQRSLFPEPFEIEADALDALAELDVERGLECVRAARRAAPDLPNLDELEEALAWLLQVCSGTGVGLASAEGVARAFVLLSRGGLGPAAASFADRALARFALARFQGEYLDAGARVPRAALELVLGRARTARLALAELLVERPERADLWSWHGDACWLDERADAANLSYVRALVIDAQSVDMLRLRHAHLRALAAELVAVHPERSARELLLVHAWLRGILAIPPGSDGFGPTAERLLARTEADERATDVEHLRRFKLLFVLDRSRPAGTCDLDQREQMLALEPELVARMLAVLRERERR